MALRDETIRVQGMHCSTCERKVEAALRALPGVTTVKANHTRGTVLVRYDPDQSSAAVLKQAIVATGYDVTKGSGLQILTILLVVGIVFLLGRNGGIDINSRLAGGATYMVVFVVGLLTSLHCAGMCGGIMLSQSLGGKPANRWQALRPALLYNAGRVTSYTILGGIVGALGSVFALTPTIKAGLMLFAGLFMAVAGTNMAGLGLFRRFNLRLPFVHRIGDGLGGKAQSPLIVGMLNGLMPCGPLQTMQLYALSTGSAAKGALAMFVFAIGTVPIMLTLGALAAFLSKGVTERISRFSGILVIGLGLVMVSRGLTLAGFQMPFASTVAARTSASGAVAKAVIADGVQTVRTTADARGYSPNLIYVQRGVPLKWTVDGKTINSCNGQITVPSQRIVKDLRAGENVIEFTPTGGDIRFSCWMGMLPGLIRVVDDLNTVDVAKPDAVAPPASSGSCHGGTTGPSIYGDDISKAPTERLVKRATMRGASQEAQFAGIGWELEPLIVVAKSDLPLKLTLDLSKADNPTGVYRVVEVDSDDEVRSIEGKSGTISADLTLKSGTYALIKDDTMIGVIAVVADPAQSDLQAIRDQFIAK
jgi:sulfite exporter TauE/SafE/copper chaperone CopZ